MIHVQHFQGRSSLWFLTLLMVTTFFFVSFLYLQIMLMSEYDGNFQRVCSQYFTDLSFIMCLTGNIMEHLEQLIWSNRIKNAVHVRFCYCNDEKIITYQKKKNVYQ